MSEGEKKTVDNADALDELLESSAKEFNQRPHTTDEELDELMAVADQKAAQAAAGQFHDMLKELVTYQEKVMEQQSAAEKEGAAPILQPEEAESTGAMIEAMKQLLVSTEKVSNAASPEELAAGLDMLKSPDSGMEPILRMIMDSVMSKDIMYEPLKQMSGKYPEFLESNKDKLEPSELERYTKQCEVINKMVTVFENQQDLPPAEGEEYVPPPPETIEKLGPLMMELHHYGAPPKEILQQFPGDCPTDENGQPVMDPSQACPIM